MLGEPLLGAAPPPPNYIEPWLRLIGDLAWPAVAIICVLVFKDYIRELLARMVRADVAGMSFDFQRKIEEAQELSERVEEPAAKPSKDVPTIPLNEANAKMLELGLTPATSGLDISYFRNIASSDPQLALAGLRIELEVMARNLVKGFKLEEVPREGITQTLRRLLGHGAITRTQMELVLKVLRLCNAAVHGMRVTEAQANEVLDVAEVLAQHYLDWLGWGFDGV